MKKQLIAICLFLLSTNYSICQNRINIFSPGKPWKDSNGNPINAHAGGILLHEGKYYWHGQIMVEGASPYGSNAQVGVSCYSSADLYNWENEGVALNVVTDDSMHFLAKGCKIERPKVIYNRKTNQFVMWFHHDIKGQGHRNALTGVAISDKVSGPFRLIKIFRPNANFWPVNVLEDQKRFPKPEALKEYSGGSLPAHPDSLNILGRDFHRGQMSRDMTLFVDEDGKAYHIYASEENSTMHISELTDDYLSFSGKYGRVFVNRFMEAPTMFKKDGRYYMINSGCTSWAPNAGRSAVAESIWGPWKELGNPFIGENADISFNSQGTFVLPVAGKKGAYIYIGDRWTPSNAVNATYIWLPIQFEGEKPIVKWMDTWTLIFFK
ncbi:MAG: family 43 glycosylhydrolase [Bacteroidetes bacterium]|nr:family 43 glycosylhydrolase [Bacteroidales bacterium]NJO68878.1 family 43 glycosylhydrolase [Bacteroidota bacterium]